MRERERERERERGRGRERERERGRETTSEGYRKMRIFFFEIFLRFFF